MEHRYLQEGAPLVEARAVSRRFGPTIALAEVSLTVERGHTHALVGRNGAGKSTLVSLLTGLQGPDAGDVVFGGKPSPPLDDRDAWDDLVACVYQHSMILPALTVAENLFINRPNLPGGFISWSRCRRDAAHLLERWSIDVPVDRLARDLGIEDRQLVEIARALSHGARFIILDEPTAQLDGDEIGRLFARVEELKAQGVTFLFISHHLQEVYDICDTVTVLRDAKHVLTAPVSETPTEVLIEAMTGEAHRPAMRRTSERRDVKPSLHADRLEGMGFAASSVDVGRGEIVGLTGSTSSGRTQLAEAVAGLIPSSGTLQVGGRTVPRGSVPEALRAGIGCVPKSRHAQGLVLHLGIDENAMMSVPHVLGRFGFLSPVLRRSRTQSLIDELDIVADTPAVPAAHLSGGNQQKVVMARALAIGPRVLVLIDPTVGVDVKSKGALLDQVVELAGGGTAVLLSSAEVDDLRICDRVIVMRHDGTRESFPAGFDEAALIKAIEGIAPCPN